MALVDELPNGALITLDSMSFIYYIEEHDQFLEVVEPIFEGIKSGQFRGVTSTLVLAELLVGPSRDNNQAFIDEYRDLFDVAENFALRPLDQVTAERAAEIRARHNLRTPDAIIVATGLEAGSQHVVTNDDVFRRITEMQSFIIKDYLPAN